MSLSLSISPLHDIVRMYVPGLNGSVKKSSSNVDSNKTTTGRTNSTTKKKLPTSGVLLQSAELAIAPSAPGQSSNASQVIGIKEIKSKQRVSRWIDRCVHREGCMNGMYRPTCKKATLSSQYDSSASDTALKCENRIDFYVTTLVFWIFTWKAFDSVVCLWTRIKPYLEIALYSYVVELIHIVSSCHELACTTCIHG